MITGELVTFLRAEFQLDWRGIHGVSHWTRVRYNGLLLARSTGALAHVVEFFAFLHDARREHDGPHTESERPSWPGSSRAASSRSSHSS